MINKTRVAWCSLLGSLLGCAMVHAQVYSLNAVAVLNVPLVSGEPELVSVQLVPVGVSGTVFTVSEVFGTNALVSGTQIKVYDAATAGYALETFGSGAWTPGTNTLRRGDSAWVTSPSNTTLKLVGYVPGSSETTTVVQVVSGLQLKGYPYPVEEAYTNALEGLGAPGDALIPVAGDGGESDRATPVAYFDGMGWMPAEGHFSLAAGWWYRSVSNRTITITKPYEYP